MKNDIHPEYREVLFHDIGVDKYFIIRSTLQTDKTKKWEDGKTYPITLLKYPLLLILFTLVNKKSLILVEEFSGLKRDLVKRNNFTLYLNSQTPLLLFLFFQNHQQY